MSIARLTVWALVLAFAVNALATTPAEYSSVTKMISLPAKVSIGAKGAVEYDKSAWKQEKQTDGTLLLTNKGKAEARVAVMRTDAGALETFSAYRMKTTKEESSVSAAFERDHLAAFTSCEAKDSKQSPGRICVTATPKLCQSLKAGEGLTPEVLKEMDAAEMKALATILTLRGSEHQLDNMIASGNRLGLKSALQTTKGQLIAFARQIAKETGRPLPTAAKTREPAQAPLVDDSKIVREVLEESLPRLKRACVDAGFTGA